MSKNSVDTEEPQLTSQYGAYALRAGLARPQSRMRMHTLTRPGTHKHTHAQACTHKPICNTYCFSTGKKMIRDRASVLGYTSIAPIVFSETISKSPSSQKEESYSNLFKFTTTFACWQACSTRRQKEKEILFTEWH
jgi:hypothetical protein